MKVHKNTDVAYTLNKFKTDSFYICLSEALLFHLGFITSNAGFFYMPTPDKMV